MNVDKTRFTLKKFLLVIIATLGTPLLVIPSAPTSVSAISAARAQECLQYTGARGFSSIPSDCREICEVSSNIDGTDGSLLGGQGTLECTIPPELRSDGASQAAGDVVRDNYYNVLATSLCEFGNDGQARIEEAACRTQLRDQVNTCVNAFFANGYEGSSMYTFPDIDVSVVGGCIADARGIPIRDVVDPMYTVENQTRTDAEAARNRALMAGRSEAECIADGDVWNEDGRVCMTRAATPPNACDLQGFSGIGWLVCPLSKFIAGTVDAIYNIFIQQLLVLPNFVANNSIQQAWGSILTIANVAFVIAFLFVIYSQITGMGISNYGIKKMLPKLVVGAILINLSFWICALAVDLSNIAGVTIYGLFRNLLPAAQAPAGNGAWVAVTTLLLAGQGTAAVAAGVTITVAGGSTLASILLTILIPALIGAIIAVVVSFVVFALRQGLAVILTILAPLAFAAALLPNTENWFDRWKKLFITVLVFYPLFAVVFGGAQVAGAILISSSQVGMNVAVGGVLVISGLVVSVFPLFAMPFLWKYSGGMVANIANRLNGGQGGILNRIRGKSRDARKRKMNVVKAGIQASSLKHASNTGDTTRRNRLKRRGLLFIGGAGRRADEEATRNAKRQQQAGYANDMINNPALAKRAGGKHGTANSAIAQAEDALSALHLDEVKAREVLIDGAVVDNEGLLALSLGETASGTNGELIDGSDLATRQAAIRHLVRRGDYGRMNELWDTVARSNRDNSPESTAVRHAMTQEFSSSDETPAWFDTSAIRAMNAGVDVSDSHELRREALRHNVYSPNQITDTHQDELELMLQEATAYAQQSQEGRRHAERFVGNATRVLNSENKRQLAKNRFMVEQISGTRFGSSGS